MTAKATPKPAPRTGAPATEIPIVGLSAARGGTRHPQGDPQPCYLLTHSPGRWTVMEGQLVPALGKLILRSGVSGVRKRADGSYDPSTAIAAAERRGQHVIPPTVDAPEHDSYCRRITIRTVTGRIVESWTSRWATYAPGAPKPTVDTAAYVAWLGSLVERGVVPRPERWALEALEDKLRRALQQHTNRASDAATDPRVASIRADLGVVQAALGAA